MEDAGSPNSCDPQRVSLNSHSFSNPFLKPFPLSKKRKSSKNVNERPHHLSLPAKPIISPEPSEQEIQVKIHRSHSVRPSGGDSACLNCLIFEYEMKRALRLFSNKLQHQIEAEEEIVKTRFIKEEEKLEKEIEIVEDDKGSPMGEFGFRVKGPEPTRYGDWERKGRVSDF